MLRQRSPASYANRLRAVMGFLASSAARRARLSAAKIFRARKFVAGIINHFVGAHFGCGVGTETVNLVRKNDEDEEHQELQRERLQHAPVGHERVRSFSGKPRTRTRKCRTDAGDEILPARGPLNQKLGGVVKLNDRDLFELESFGHASAYFWLRCNTGGKQVVS